MVKDLHPVTFGILGFVLGLIVYGWFLKPESETTTVIKETFKTDTVFVVQKDTVTLYRDKIKHEYLRDTILLPDWRPSIKAFKAVYPVLYGNIHLSGEVLGEVLKTSITTDFNIPTVTNTITRDKTTTIIKKPTGFYTVGGFNSDFKYSVGATYLKDNSMIGYRYQPQLKIHSLEVGFKVFGK
jgi:hypothetical protein